MQELMLMLTHDVQRLHPSSQVGGGGTNTIVFVPVR